MLMRCEEIKEGLRFHGLRTSGLKEDIAGRFSEDHVLTEGFIAVAYLSPATISSLAVEKQGLMRKSSTALRITAD